MSHVDNGQRFMQLLNFLIQQMHHTRISSSPGGNSQRICIQPAEGIKMMQLLLSSVITEDCESISKYFRYTTITENANYRNRRNTACEQQKAVNLLHGMLSRFCRSWQSQIVCTLDALIKCMLQMWWVLC